MLSELITLAFKTNGQNMFFLGYSRPTTSYNQQPKNTNVAPKVEDKMRTSIYGPQVNTVFVFKVCSHVI